VTTIPPSDPYQTPPETTVAAAKPPIFKQWWFWLVAAVAVAAVAVAAVLLLGGGDEDSADSPKQDSPAKTSDAPDPDPSESKSSLDDIPATVTFDTPGDYEVGVDIRPGRYVATIKDDGQANFAFASSHGRIMLSNAYGEDTWTGDLLEGEWLQITADSKGGPFVLTFTPVERSLEAGPAFQLTSGHWFVGKDIPAGKYQLTVPGDQCGIIYFFDGDNVELASAEVEGAALDEGACMGEDSVTVTLKDGYKVSVITPLFYFNAV
jgi:hypothetical protein